MLSGIPPAYVLSLAIHKGSHLVEQEDFRLVDRRDKNAQCGSEMPQSGEAVTSW